MSSSSTDVHSREEAAEVLESSRKRLLGYLAFNVAFHAESHCSCLPEVRGVRATSRLKEQVQGREVEHAIPIAFCH